MWLFPVGSTPGAGTAWAVAECRRPAEQVAEWAGHSVNVLLRVYAKCVYGQDEVTRIRIEAALALTTAAEEPPVAVTSSRIPPEHP